MANNRSPDRYESDAIHSEEPPKIRYADHQPGLDADMLSAVDFPQSRPIRETWKGMPPKRREDR